MFWLDTLILVLLAVGAGLGFIGGFLWQIARILTLTVALWATVAFNDSAALFCQEHLLQGADPRIAQGVAYVLVFLIVYLLIFLVTRLLVAGIRATDFEVVDRLAGGVFGAGKMALAVAACCLAAANSPHPTARAWMDKSALAPAFAGGMEQVLHIIPDDYKDHLRGTLVSLRDLLARPTGETPAEEKSKIDGGSLQ